MLEIFSLPKSIDPSGEISSFLNICLDKRFAKNNVTIVTTRHRLVLYLAESEQYVKIATTPEISPVGESYNLMKMSEIEWAAWHIVNGGTLDLHQPEQYRLGDSILVCCYPCLGSEKLNTQKLVNQGSQILVDAINKLTASNQKFTGLIPEARSWNPRQELYKRLESRFVNDLDSLECAAARETVVSFSHLIYDLDYWVDEYNTLTQYKPKIIVTDPTADNTVYNRTYGTAHIIDLENISWGVPAYSLVSLVSSVIGEQYPSLSHYSPMSLLYEVKSSTDDGGLFDADDRMLRILMSYKLISTAMFNKDDKEKFNHLIQEANHLIHA